MAGNTKGCVFNIQRYSIHDGAGIRTLVFLKGCPLRCLWCSNPESHKSGPELGFIESRCVGIGVCRGPCLAACPIAALYLNEQGKPSVDRQACNACGLCSEVCREDALKVVGREMSVDEVLAEVEKDRPFYRRSSGGVTLGGGEPLMQYRFTAELLESAQRVYLHTALETCGHAPWEHFEAVLKHVDLLYIDLKHMDPIRHKELTGKSNRLIIANLRKVLSVKPPQDVIVRVPVIPGYNDSIENLEDTAKFVAELGFRLIELIPYHRFGVSKYTQYGMVYQLSGVDTIPQAYIDELRKMVTNLGLTEMTGSI